MYLATRGSERLCESDDLDQVVKYAEIRMGDGQGDVIIWEDEKTIAVEMTDEGDGNVGIHYCK